MKGQSQIEFTIQELQTVKSLINHKITNFEKKLKPNGGGIWNMMKFQQNKWNVTMIYIVTATVLVLKLELQLKLKLQQNVTLV